MNIAASTVVMIIVLAFLAFFVLKGHKKGFLKVALSTFSFIIVIILSMALSKPVSNFIGNTSWGDSIEESVGELVDTKIDEFLEDSGDEIPEDEENTFIESLPLPSFIQNTLKSGNTLEEYVEMQVETFEEYTAAKFTDIIISAISYVIVMILAAVIIRLLLKGAKFVNKIPIIGGINKFLGALLGFFEGLLILWAVGLFIISVSGTSFGESIILLIQSNPVLDFIFDNNLLVIIFSAVI